MSKYQGANVTVVREARKGDVGFDANKEQSLIRMEDGTEKVVLTAEITN